MYWRNFDKTGNCPEDFKVETLAWPHHFNIFSWASTFLYLIMIVACLQSLIGFVDVIRNFQTKNKLQNLLKVNSSNGQNCAFWQAIRNVEKLIKHWKWIWNACTELHARQMSGKYLNVFFYLKDSDPIGG